MRISKKFLLQSISYHQIHNRNLFIIPQFPAWFELSDICSVALHCFLTTKNDEEAVLLTRIQAKCDEELARNSVIEIKTLLKTKGVFPTVKLFDAPDYNKKNPITNLHIALTHNCNLSCKHCYISAGAALKHELDFEEWRIGLKALLHIIKNPEITISGGEPTLFPQLLSILKIVKEKSKNVALYTNGLSNINAYLPYLDRVQFSLEGISEKTNDLIRGNGTYKKILKNIKEFPEKNKLKIALTIMKHNFKEIKEGLYSWIAENNLEKENIRLSAELEQEGRAEQLDSSYYDFIQEESYDIYSFISKFYDDQSVNFRKQFINLRNCGIGLSFGINSDGSIHPCDEFNNVIGNILDIDLEKIIKIGTDINKNTEIDKLEKCKSCDLRLICLGGCRAKNLKYNGSYTIPFCTERTKYIRYTKLLFNL